MKWSRESHEWLYSKAWELMARHGLKKEGWNFQTGNRKSALGVCKHHKKQIVLSDWFIWHEQSTKEEIVDTLLHEIAHALCPGDKHGKKWRETALAIGCNGKRTGYYDNTDICKYIAVCSKCGQKHGLNRMGKVLKRDLTTDRTVYRCYCGNPVKFQHNENI